MAHIKNNFCCGSLEEYNNLTFPYMKKYGQKEVSDYIKSLQNNPERDLEEDLFTIIEEGLKAKFTL